MKVLKNAARFVLVTAGIVLLTSVTIDATTSYNVSQSALGILARDVTKTACDEGMTEFVSNGARLCVDVHEVSPGSECRHKVVSSIKDSRDNLATEGCFGESGVEELPWTSVTYHQAKEVCAKRSARLPTHIEWYDYALGTPDSSACNIDTGTLKRTGTSASCISGSGVFDAIGNSWEWIEGGVVNGTYNNRTLPQSGYVRDADSAGVALVTAPSPSDSFHDDYFWGSASGTFAMIRGGFYGSDSDAGLYSIHADVEASFAGNAVGFRCVKDL